MLNLSLKNEFIVVPHRTLFILLSLFAMLGQASHTLSVLAPAQSIVSMPCHEHHSETANAEKPLQVCKLNCSCDACLMMQCQSTAQVAIDAIEPLPPAHFIYLSAVPTYTKTIYHHPRLRPPIDAA